jgi:hypothetical protein
MNPQSTATTKGITPPLINQSNNPHLINQRNSPRQPILAFLKAS